MSEDQDLRERFASLRREEAGRTPRFEHVLQRARLRYAKARQESARQESGAQQGSAQGVRAGDHRGFRMWAPTAAVAACVAAVVAVLMFQPSHRPGTRGQVPQLADWRAPTDFLVDTPASELMRTVPRIGEPARDLARPLPLHLNLNLVDPAPSRRIG